MRFALKSASLAAALMLAALAPPAFAYVGGKSSGNVFQSSHAGLRDATLLIVRHGEKDGLGRGLSPAGKMRALAYAEYFERFELNGKPIRIDALVASQDSHKSERPRLTLEPLSKQLSLVIYQPSPDHEVRDLVGWLKSRPAGQTTLISWHHGHIPALLQALKVNPADVLPGGLWPSDAFDWVIVLRFDAIGRVIVDDTHLIKEPDGVNDTVWAAMDHPSIRPMGTPEKAKGGTAATP